jgi:hypothetical protein
VVSCKSEDSGLESSESMPVAERVEAVSVDRSGIFLESEETRSGVTRLIVSELNPCGLIHYCLPGVPA